MKKSDINKIVQEVLKEMSVTGGGGGAAPVGGGATFTPGQGENYAVPLRTNKKKVTKEIYLFHESKAIIINRNS